MDTLERIAVALERIAERLAPSQSDSVWSDLFYDLLPLSRGEMEAVMNLKSYQEMYETVVAIRDAEE